MLAGVQDADRDIGAEAFQFGRLDGGEFRVLGNGGVPDDAGIDAAEFHVVGDVAHGGLEDGGGGREGRPLATAGEGGPGQGTDGGGVGVGKGDARARA